jgi:hypothetical protein
MPTRRRSGSYIGGHTVISLGRKTVEIGLVEQAREVRQRQYQDQQSFDETHALQVENALRLARKNRPKVLGAQAVQDYYRKQIHFIEVLLKGKPSYMPRLLEQLLDLLEKLLRATEGGARRKIMRRMRDAERQLERLQK